MGLFPDISGPGPESSFARFRDWAIDSWTASNPSGIKPSWNGKDFDNLRRLFLELGGHEAVQVWRAYLLDERPYYDGHSPAKCYSERNALRVRAIEPPEPKRVKQVDRSGLEASRERHRRQLEDRRAEVLASAAEIRRLRPDVSEVDAYRMAESGVSPRSVLYRKQAEKPSITKAMVGDLKRLLKG